MTTLLLSLGMMLPNALRSVAPGVLRTAMPAMMGEPVGIQHFLRDLEFLGPCRFVVQGQGAILEAVGSFDDMRVSGKYEYLIHHLRHGTGQLSDANRVG